MTIFNNKPAIITIDGPTASGKGTIARALAQTLGFHYLDSGALYRILAWHSAQLGVASDDEIALADCARMLDCRFDSATVWCGATDVTEVIRSEANGLRASQVSQYLGVRQALLQLQKDFARAPGLVADGRDMGTVVFATAPLKIFLTASAQIRAQRRAAQLGLDEKRDAGTIRTLLQDLQARDARDQNRTHAPLVAAADAYTLVNEGLSVAEALALVLQWWHEKKLSI